MLECLSTQYNHIVDANLSFVQVFNTDNKPTKISRWVQIDCLSSRVYSAAYEVDVFAVDITLQDDVDLPSAPHHPNYNLNLDTNSTKEFVFPNSVHVYTENKEYCNTFTNLVLNHPIWGETEGFVDILEIE